MNGIRILQRPQCEPWLVDALVIASTERQREPELAAATIDAALAAPLPTTSALYDVIVIAIETSTAVAAALHHLEQLFTAHHHRVFRLDASSACGPNGDDALAKLRHDQGIAAAVIVTAAEWSGDLWRNARRVWGWRCATVSTDPTTTSRGVFALGGADVRLPVELIQEAAIGMSGCGTVEEGETESSASAWSTIDRAIRDAFPQATVAILTHDNLAFSRLCLESLLANTEYPNFELVVVDNASTDGTPAYLRDLAGRFPFVRLIFNDSNVGFGRGNNQALAAATGEILVLLNNDTLLPHGWLTRLAQHLTDPQLGLLGPATNRTCNEAQVDAPYETYGDFLCFAQKRAVAYDGLRHAIRMPMMFCTAFRRQILEQIGSLDERFEIGMFEDEDYSLRVQAAGYQVAWAPDVYVHHAYHASIGKLLPSGRYTALFNANQQRFEEKWGICWERHRPAPLPAAAGQSPS